ncbi:transcription antitermination factor NusB [Frisingicoccus sp.]|uniref:transcription antitermination factor NusB n=1 Tax=Frisingicoccus sp. TaxID=1918627 RepID=UPI002EC703B9|nr:transcription antitermination factor NusB [Frisingicoccus sp.]
MSRRELREHIFRLIFRMEFHAEDEMAEQEGLYLDNLVEVSDEDKDYIKKKADAVQTQKEELDSKIDEVADKWKTGRMTKVDLTVIRLAAYEILYDEEVPTGVAINEAVELAKRYGTDQSPAFVNGILAKLA